MQEIYTATYPKSMGQNVDTQQKIGKDMYTPKGRGGTPNPAAKGEGLHSFKPGNAKTGLTLSTDKHQATLRGPFVKTGGDAMTFNGAKSGKYSTPKLGTEERKPDDAFVCKKTSTYGVGGV
jgi:hypothetical protein